jgi:RHS repeat-associated protein
MVRGGVTYAYVKNHLGTVKLVVNAVTGAVVQRIESDAWGNVLSDSNPGFQPFIFAGGVFDNDTRLTHFGFRDYDSSSGSWLSPEPMLQDPSWVKGEAQEGFSAPIYAYARNNPLRYIDPTGLYSWIDECVGAGLSVWGEMNNEGGAEGMSGRISLPALRLEPLESSVQYKSPGTSACQDADSAREIQRRYLQGYGPAVRTCWRLMIRQMDAACNLERGTAPKKIPPSTKPGGSLTCER